MTTQINLPAMTTHELDQIFFQAKIQRFDKNFFNFEDPAVYRKFIDPNDTAIWSETYGYDYACMYKVIHGSLTKDKAPFVRSVLNLYK